MLPTDIHASASELSFIYTGCLCYQNYAKDNRNGGGLLVTKAIFLVGILILGSCDKKVEENVVIATRVTVDDSRDSSANQLGPLLDDQMVKGIECNDIWVACKDQVLLTKKAFVRAVHIAKALTEIDQNQVYIGTEIPNGCRCEETECVAIGKPIRFLCSIGAGTGYEMVLNSKFKLESLSIFAP